MKIKILIVDDHPLLRGGVRRIVEDAADVTVVGETGNAADALRMLGVQPCDIAVVDISLPDLSGLDFIREATKLRPQLKVLILSMFAEEQYAVRALRAGAAGYLNKRSAPEELLQALRAIHRAGRYISPELANLLAAELYAPAGKALHETLSDREYQVFCLLAAGKSVSDIAASLSLSVTTISTYRTRILEKMNCKSNADLTRYALEHRLID